MEDEEEEEDAKTIETEPAGKDFDSTDGQPITDTISSEAEL